MCGMVLYIGDSVPSVTGAACFFRWVSRSGTYRDGTAVGNVTNVVCISTPCSQRFVQQFSPYSIALKRMVVL